MSEDATRKAKLIEQILNRIKPIPENAPDDVKDGIDTERQMLAMRAGWTKMSVSELEAVLAGNGG